MEKIKLPEIADQDKTPIIEELLAIIEGLLKSVEALEEENRRLKKLSNKPKFFPKKHHKKHSSSSNSSQNTPSENSSVVERRVHEEKIIDIPSNELPETSRFKGYRYYYVQDLQINPHHTLFKLARWQLPDGKFKTAPLPGIYRGYHFGPTLRTYILHQYYDQRVTQPRLLSQLHEWGIKISNGELSDLLTKGKEAYHQEKEHLLEAGLKASDCIHTDDTGARHQGEMYYCTQVGNEHFTYFKTTKHNNRLEFLKILHGSDLLFCLDEKVIAAVQQEGVSYYHAWRLGNFIQNYCQGERCFTRIQDICRFLKNRSLGSSRCLKLLIEYSLLQGLAKKLGPQGLTIVSDEARRFAIENAEITDTLRNALCWLHAERKIRILTPLTKLHAKQMKSIQARFWNIYEVLKAYKENPTNYLKNRIRKRLDRLLATETTYVLLKSALQRIASIKERLLKVLEKPSISLHNNLSENDIREHVIRRKISGSTRSEEGKQCRDTFASLSKTCRKNKISFWNYLLDRVFQQGQIPSLADVVVQATNSRTLPMSVS